MSALSKDRQTLYLFVEGVPTGPIALKGIKNDIARIRIVGDGSMLTHTIYNKLYWSERPGIIYIDIPKERLDKQMTVIAVLLNKPIELYRKMPEPLKTIFNVKTKSGEIILRIFYFVRNSLRKSLFLKNGTELRLMHSRLNLNHEQHFLRCFSQTFF